MKYLNILIAIIFFIAFTGCPEELDLSNKIEIKNN